MRKSLILICLLALILPPTLRADEGIYTSSGGGGGGGDTTSSYIIAGGTDSQLPNAVPLGNMSNGVLKNTGGTLGICSNLSDTSYLPLSGGSLTGALTDSSGFVGPLTGNVTGNVTGHASADLALSGGTLTGALTDSSGFVGPLTGNVTGNVTGTASGNQPTFTYDAVRDGGIITTTGTTDIGPTFRSWLAGLATPCRVIFPPLASGYKYYIGSNLQVPAGVDLQIQPGGMLTLASGCWLKIGGQIVDGRHRMFNDLNTTVTTSTGVLLTTGAAGPTRSQNQFVRPEWWGADPIAPSSNTTTTTLAFNQALNALSQYGGTCQASGGWYYLNGTLNFPSGDFMVTLAGLNSCSVWDYNQVTTISGTTDAPVINLTSNVELVGIAFLNPSLVTNHLIYNSTNATNVVIEKCYFVTPLTNPWIAAIYATNLHICKIKDNHFTCCNAIMGYIYDSEICDNRGGGPVGQASNIWSAGASITAGNWIRPTNSEYTQYYFLATNSGTTGGTQPAQWPDVFGDYGIRMYRYPQAGQTAPLITVASGKYHRSSGSWVTDGFSSSSPTCNIYVSGFTNAANNGLQTVTNVTASDLTVSNTLVNETPGVPVFFCPTILDNNVTWAAIPPPTAFMIYGGVGKISGNFFEGYNAFLSSGIYDVLNGGINQSTIINNYTQQNDFGIYTGASSGCIAYSTIMGNVFASGPNGIDGLYSYGNSTYDVVTGNVFSSNPGVGYHINSGSYLSLGPNTFYNNGTNITDNSTNPVYSGNAAAAQGLAGGSAGALAYQTGAGSTGFITDVAAGSPLLSGGTGSAPVYGALNLAGGSNSVSGVLPGANGGAGSASGVLKANGSGTVSACSNLSDTSYLPLAGGTMSGTLTLSATPSVGDDSAKGATTAYVDRQAPSTYSTSSASSVSPNLNSYTAYVFTAQAATLTINAVSNGNWFQPVYFAIKDNGTAQTLTWDASYKFTADTVKPTGTLGTTAQWLLCKGYYNGTDSTTIITGVTSVTSP